MKKMNRAVFLVLIILTALAGITCKPYVGLGGQIDILPPSGEITYPDAGETPIRGSFVLKGTAKDDDGIQSISVVFENIETKERSRAYEAEGFSKGNVSASWTISVNNESTGTEPGHDLVKVYPIPDGEYTAIVSVTDKGGKTSTFTKNYKIDNTPPVFIVSRPSTIVGKDETTTPQADGYGATFSVVGQAGEQNTVEELEVLVNGTAPIKNMYVGKNINAKIAVYSTSPTNPLYDLQAQDRTKPIRGRLYLYDNAREYKGGSASGEGNKADWYYVWDSIYIDVIAKGYTPEVISDYFAGKKGSDKNEHDQKILALRGDTNALNTLKSAMTKMEEKRSTFKLDPSISPGFKVIGVKNLPKNTLNLGHTSSMLFKTGNETSFSVELIRNKDNTPLVKGAALAQYKESNIEIVLAKWNGTGTAEDSFKTGTNLEEKTLVKFSDLANTNNITVEGGSLRITCVFNPDWGEGYYALKVKGTDTHPSGTHTFEAYDDSNSVNDGIYIINFLAVGNGPRIRAIRPQGFQKGNFEIFAAVTGIDSTGVVYYNIGGSVPTSPYPATVLTKADPADQSDHKYKATIDVSSLSDGDHEIHFLVKAGSGSTDADKTDFAIDKTPPTADISYPLPADPQAGKITISGTITDGTGSSVKEAGTKYILGKKSSTPALTDSGWQNMTTSTKGSWNVDVDLDTMSAHPENYGTQVGTSSYYKVPLYIRSEDMLGNAKVHVKEILFNSDGTKPVVRVLSPQADAVVGGTIQIFGTASAVTGGPSAVGEVYVQFSKTTDFTNQANMTFGTSGGGYDANWYQGGNGQRVPGTGSGPGEKGSEWRLEINGNGAFNGTSQRQDLYFRFRAKNKNYSDRWGEWTTPVKIIVDKDAPLITDVKIENISMPPSPQNYETNMWIGSGKKLTAKLTDPSGIKEVKITSSKMSGGISYTKATAPTGWLTPYSAGGVSGYTLSIPLNISGMSGNDFSIKVEITEDTTTGLKSDSTFTFRFDTTAPTGFFGSGLYINSGYFGDSSVTNAALADKLRDLGANTSSGAGCKILADNTELTVTSVLGSTVSFTPSTTTKEYNYILYKPETLIYNESSSSPWIVKGVANDDGSGVAKVEAWVTVDNGSTAHTIITETDNTNKITRQLGGQVTWKGQINLDSLKDGKGTLHYKITDKSGNEYNAPPVDVRVKNKPIKVKTITLVTDIGGSAVEFANNNVNKALKNIDVDSNLDFTANYTSSAFAFKNETNSKIKVNFDGGQGQVKYSLKYNNAILAGHDMQNIGNGGIITLTPANLNTIGNTTGETTKELTLELWDSAHDCSPTGTAPFGKSSFAEVKINTLFEAIDTKPPTVVILPFHWNKEDDNSLYQNSRANGHVEIAKINSLGNDHPSVSGKVTIRGFAYDNIKIDSITAEVSGKTLTAALSGNGPWTAGTITSADGIVLKVKKLGADYLGYYVTWQIDWDTEKAGVGLAKDIKVTANDGTTTFSDTGVTTAKTTGVTRTEKRSAENAVFANKKPGQFVVFTKGETQYLTRIRSVTGNTATLEDDVPIEADEVYMYAYTANKPKTKVNVVPYITEVVTGLTSADGGFKGAFSRASTGEYPVRAGETTESSAEKEKRKIHIKGFNLKHNSTYGNAFLGTRDLGNALESIYLDSSTSTSDELKVSVNSIDSINNKVDITKPYNLEDNGINNDILNANRKLFVWKMEPIINNNAMESPQFVMDKESNYYLAFGNLRTIGSGGWDAMRLSTKISKNGTVTASDDWEFCYSKFQNTMIGYDGNGNPYLGATDTDRATGQSTGFSFCFQQPSNSSNYSLGMNKTRLENCDNELTNVYDVNRVRIPKIAVRGGGTTADPAKIAMVYFDGNMKDDSAVKFRFGTVINVETSVPTVSGTRTAITGGIAYNVGNNGVGSDPDSPKKSGSAKGYEIIADTADSTTYKSGLYAAVGLTSTNRAVAVWYDATGSRLVYSYRDMGASYTAPGVGGDRKTNEWQAHAVEIDGGAPLYVDVVIDDEDGLHIGYYSSSKGGVKYAYLPPDKVKGTTKPVSTDFKVATVDTHMNPGTFLKIGVRKEGTKQVPYISYYHNGFYGSKNAARIAWLKDGIGSDGTVKTGVVNNKFTGDWVVMTVPASNGIQQYTICQGVPSSGDYANKVVAAYFTTKNYEMAVLSKN
ncbi:Ig-like domain repeat protein [Treponema sp. OMZ 855]|uniref:Ig-like domain repeat protein n=1 Tax=Treponema sp. OMZ 855 TaxID=1643512 RepID=UPI0020A24249|nr:Ig-like domain repeat protein [Treponema sp. OMZ 855]UTC51336.1 Ig-like domain repeat protein [Treponema sp. OMZ 855]